MTLPEMPALHPGTDPAGRVPRPPLDPTAAALLDLLPPAASSAARISAHRARAMPDASEIATAAGLVAHERHAAADDGHRTPVTVFTRPDPGEPGPCFVFVHGGGMVAGTVLDLGQTLDLVSEHGGALFSLGYRLAPEHPAPRGLRDAYAGLEWAVAHAREFGADPDRVVLVGASAGGGLAAGMALLARDTGGPEVRGMQLHSPMLDDRSATVSQEQFDTIGVWTRRLNEAAWRAALGDDVAATRVSPYVAPARATNLSGLPPVLITVGSADPFRDEDVAFASALWRDGGDCELYVAAGGVHGFETLGPLTPIARTWGDVVRRWTRRVLAPGEPDRDAVALIAARLRPNGADAGAGARETP
jgi:acetyl esterase/lipase